MLVQSTTFTTSPCLLMATAPAPKLIWTRTFAARNPHATIRTLQTVRSATYLASMAILPAVPSKPRKFFSFLPSLSLPSSGRNRFSPAHKPTPFANAYHPILRYLDLYLSTVRGPASFFGNRSIVVHSNNATRLTCANFTLIAGNSTITGGTAPVPTSSQSAYKGGAATKLVSIGAVLAGLVAFVL